MRAGQGYLPSPGHEARCLASDSPSSLVASPPQLEVMGFVEASVAGREARLPQKLTLLLPPLAFENVLEGCGRDMGEGRCGPSPRRRQQRLFLCVLPSLLNQQAGLP